ncbi:autotransporter outer membrane beta-barrel domain-containing protein [Rhizobium sp. BK377]|uniref:autotransporter family protein n=1 Tax=Rhizobium sp. BK377 TaxID=2587058 RepID=UPI00183B03D5|nr:autotransporter outer membrane beta-barrel domain-containing protein [Rhizobium sp. BK377]MBB3461291.1 fibronectin-binding autotransporter adhesin [Rhizobium sp. BK377]
MSVVGTFDKARLFTGVSLTALMLCYCISSPAWAGSYPVNSDAALRAAIQTANADGDANATIVMTGNFSISTTALPNPTKPITIDTNGFVLTNTYDPTAGTSRGTLTIQQLAGANVPVTFSGTLVGANAGAAATTAGQIGVAATATKFTNDGSIRGGNGGGGGGAAASGGSGVRVQTGSSLTNNGTIVGGDSTSAGGGAGVAYGNAVGGPNTILNMGTIRGGNGPTNGTAGGGSGILAQGGNAGQIVNSGTIEGGTGAAAIVASNGIINLDIVNSGTIRAGAGQANAITRSLAATTGRLTLELQPGSVIEGNVIAGAVPTTDVLRLGGTGSDSFDISRIGAAAQYQNFDTFEKTGSSTWLLTGVGTATTDWTIYDGTLLVGDHSAPASVIGDITNFGTLGGSGTIFGDVTSSGTVAPGNSIGTLTISGNYTGNGGTLAIESVLGGDASPTDRLVVTGNTAGMTNVKVTNLGGGGAQTVEGIKIVDVGGTSAGSFSLLGDYVFQGDQAVVGGAYAYRLYQNGVSTPADGDWYLRSALTNPATSSAPTAPLYQPGVPLYEAYPQLLLALNGLSTLQQRLGDRYWHGDSAAALAKGPDNVWLRTEGTHASIEPDSSTTVDSYDYNLFKLEGGLDGELYQDKAGRLIGGLTVHYGTISGDIDSLYGNGDIDTTGFGLGATLTWYGDDGLYVDAQSHVTWYDTDLKSDLVDGAMESGNNGFGYALSLETGRRFAASGPWSITPQAQLVYSSVDFDTFNDRFGARVSLDDGDSLLGRLGVALDREETMQRANGQTALAKIYGIANLYGEFLDGTAVDVSGTGFETKNDPVWAGLTLGGSYTWNDDRYSLYGEVAAKSSLKDFGDSYALSGTAGLRVKW